MACMFETVSWTEKLPQWNLSVNAQRAETLKKAVDAKELCRWSSSARCTPATSSASNGETIDAFYAQWWAFARFLWEARTASTARRCRSG